MIPLKEAEELGLTRISYWHRSNITQPGHDTDWLTWCAERAAGLIRQGQHAEVVENGHGSCSLWFLDKTGAWRNSAVPTCRGRPKRRRSKYLDQG